MTDEQIRKDGHLLSGLVVYGGYQEHRKLRRRRMYDHLIQSCRGDLRVEMAELYRLGRYHHEFLREAEYIEQNIHLFSLQQLVLIAHHWRVESNRRFDNMMRLIWGKRYAKTGGKAQ